MLDYMKLTVFLCVILGLLNGCSRTNESNTRAQVSDELLPEDVSCLDTEGQVQKSAERRISFENVSFSLSDAWVTDVEYFVKPECVLTRDDIKPDSVGGRTLRFNLRYNASESVAEIEVFKVEDYKRAFAGYPQYIDNPGSELRATITNGSRIETYGLRPPPLFKWMDAHEVFYAKAERVNFVNGEGLLFVTEISQDAYGTISNSSLRFFYQGFTSDGTYFVQMDIPTRLRGLPNESEEFLPTKDGKPLLYNSIEHGSAYERYIKETAARVDMAPSTAFRPQLDQVKKFIRGFEIK